MTDTSNVTIYHSLMRSSMRKNMRSLFQRKHGQISRFKLCEKTQRFVPISKGVGYVKPSFSHYLKEKFQTAFLPRGYPDTGCVPYHALILLPSVQGIHEIFFLAIYAFGYGNDHWNSWPSSSFTSCRAQSGILPSSIDKKRRHP